MERKSVRSLTGEVEEMVSGTPDIKEASSVSKEKPGPCIRVVLTKDGESEYYHQQIILENDDASGFLDDQDCCISKQPVITFDSMTPLPAQNMIRLHSAGGKVKVSSLDRAQGKPSYEGILEIRKTNQGFLLINELDLETYLRYVVPSEMPSTYEKEALKAQAVCARTYAWKALEEKRMEQYHGDVDDTVSFQVYNNFGHHPSTDQAVAETKGKVMTSDGRLITAYFFSTSCGHTSTDEVWNGESKEKYLKSTFLSDVEQQDLEAEETFSAFIRSNVPTYDKGELWYRWSIVFPIKELQLRLNETNPDAGSFQDMKVRARSKGGAVKELMIQGSKESICLTNEYDIRQWLSPGNLPLERGGEKKSGEMRLLPSAYFTMKPIFDHTGKMQAYQIIGGGYGHGVGMSQNGANAMAKEGKTWREILLFFFCNIEIAEEEE